MKPLIRQFIYDKLRRSLYHHELKTKVWNNPYFPFLTQEEWNIYIEREISKFKNQSHVIEEGHSLSDYDISKQVLFNALKNCHNNIKKLRIASLSDYNVYVSSLKNEDNYQIYKTIMYELFSSNNKILQQIEEHYGKNICGCFVANKK